MYVVFIDFSKAYDRVPRNKLLELLKSQGCGKFMLTALKNMYKCTKNMLKAATVEATVGVRQGAPSSCLLFVIYIDKMVRMLKETIREDGFLGTLHLLLLMDDTVIMATSREMCLKKLEVVVKYCTEYGMMLNEKKTKFFVINHEKNDKLKLKVQGHDINYCQQYLYLGAWFTDTTKMDKVIELHEASGEMVVHKFAVFCASNTNMPYSFKRKVFDAAVTSALLYSTETWLTNKFKRIEKQYNKLIKCLLAVRKNTSINLCLIESGISPVQLVITKQRKRFLESKLREANAEEPIYLVYRLCREANTPGYRFINDQLQSNLAIDPLAKVKELVNNMPVTATKYITYKTELNTGLGLHQVYSGEKYIPDWLRQAFSRLRLMSHNLRVERGRWSRTPREQRVCECHSGCIQTERHVLLECAMSAGLRNRYSQLNFSSLENLLGESEFIIDLCKYIYGVFELYKVEN